MRHLGIASFTALLLTTLLSTHAALADDEALAIVHLAFRDHIVTIRSSPQGIRYSVRTTSGTLLSEDLTDEQLLAAHPELHSDIHSSYASGESESLIWAGRNDSQVEPAVEAITHPEGSADDAVQRHLLRSLRDRDRPKSQPSDGVRLRRPGQAR